MQPDQSGSQQNVSSTLSSKNSPGSEISVSPNKSKLKPKQSGKPKSKVKANNGDTKSKKAPEKRKKSVLPSRCVLILKTWMMSPEHIHHPYPTEEQKLELCHRTGIGLKQLTNWFTNNRKRLWRPHMRQLIAQREEAGLSKRNLPKQSTKLLKDWLLSPEHIHHPYPTDEEKELLMEDTGIGMKQLTNWFTNARKRIWQPMFTSSSSASVTATATAAAAAASLGIIDIDIARVQRGAKAALSARNAKKGGRAAHDASAVSGGMHTLSGSPRSQARCRKKGNGRTLANASEVAVKPASRNDFMLYVQCLSCKKWRKLPIGTFDVSDVPRKWTCSMAHNGGFSSKEAQKKANQEFNEQQELRDKTGLGHWLSPSCRILQQKLLPGRAPPWPSLDSEGGCLPVKLQPPVVRVSVKHEVKKKEMNAMRDYVRNDTEAKDARATTALAGFGEPIEWTPGHVDDIDNAWATNIDVAAVAIPATQITDPNGVLVINPVNNISDIKLCVDVSNSIKNQNTNIVNDDDTDRQSMDIDEKGTSSQAEVPT
eukprot:GSMAST32.ASY1.ANO1.836.1 assembled CDS